jgi:hypothetical protein
MAVRRALFITAASMRAMRPIQRRVVAHHGWKFDRPVDTLPSR